MLDTIRNMITDVFPDVWPIIIIITVIACSLRLAYLIKNNISFIRNLRLIIEIISKYIKLSIIK